MKLRGEQKKFYKLVDDLHIGQGVPIDQAIVRAMSKLPSKYVAVKVYLNFMATTEDNDVLADRLDDFKLSAMWNNIEAKSSLGFAGDKNTITNWHHTYNKSVEDLPAIGVEVLVRVVYEGHTYDDGYVKLSSRETAQRYSYIEPNTGFPWSMGSATNYFITHFAYVTDPVTGELITE